MEEDFAKSAGDVVTSALAERKRVNQAGRHGGAKRAPARGERIKLSMKLAETQIFRELAGEAPVLILDDVMSELDLPRRRKLLERVRDIQCILTCTHAERVLYGAECNKIRIREGKIVS